jgi:hypothetical protein
MKPRSYFLICMQQHELNITLAVNREMTFPAEQDTRIEVRWRMSEGQHRTKHALAMTDCTANKQQKLLPLYHQATEQGAILLPQSTD